MYKEKHSPAWTPRAAMVSNAVFCVSLSSHISTDYHLTGCPGTTFFALPARLPSINDPLLFPAEGEVAYAQAC